MENTLKVKEQFDGWIKYPSTKYFDFSPTIVENKDELIKGKNKTFDINNFVNCPIVITVKMDGSNITMTKDHIAARNGWCAKHESFDMAKAEHAKIKYMIPENLQFFGEWLYAKHSIEYSNLDDYFQVFSIYNKNIHEFLSWNEIKEISKNLGLITVPVLDNGLIEIESGRLINKIINFAENSINNFGQEGLVVRKVSSFHYSQFENTVAKYVRLNHVQTDEHWSQQKIVRNKLK